MGPAGNKPFDAAANSAPEEVRPADSPDALARRYRAALQRFFERRLHHRADAEDLAQEVLLRLSQQQPRTRTHPAYIFLTARSVLLDKIRRDQARERSAHCELDGAALPEVPSAERIYSAQERVARVSKLMAELTPRVREVFTLHRVEGMAYSEIARSLGISVSTVEKHMIAALRFLVQHAEEVQ